MQTIQGFGLEELDLPRIFEHRLARLGDGDGVRATDEHLPEAGLEGADALARRRRGDTENEGPTLHRALVDDSGQSFDMINVHEAIVHHM